MSLKVLTKGCKKCGGDLFLEYEEEGFCLICIQCGYVDYTLQGLSFLRSAGSSRSREDMAVRREPVMASSE
jgi:ribosomal protein S27AE